MHYYIQYKGLFIIILTVIYGLHLSTGWRYENHNIMHFNQHSVVYWCPLNTMCQCVSLPNETNQLLQISCNDVSLYKFPEFLHNSLKHIEIAKTSIQHVDDEAFQGLRLESLKLVDNNIQELSSKSFSSMTQSLISLDISGNQFQRLPLDSIHSIHTLSRLIAQRNYIENLDGNWGNLVDSLRNLNLGSNSITEIALTHDDRHHNSINDLNNQNHTSSSSSMYTPSISQQTSSSLSTLNHYGNSILGGSGSSGSSSGNGGTLKSFAKLRKLVWLDLSGNRINHINHLVMPKSLVTIDLTKNLLTTFPVQLFNHLRDLKIISLKDNLIGKIINILFDNGNSGGTTSIQIDKLDIGCNHLKELPTDLFNGTMQIKIINFDRNFITELRSNTFSNLHTVHMVLSNNEIKTVDKNAFNGLENTLEYLDMERNQLTRVPSSINELNKIRYVYLTGNQISNIVEHLPSTLLVLSLASNNFTTIPVDGLANCTKLIYLNLGYNRIADLNVNEFVGWGQNLQTILMRNNKLARLNDGAFNGLEQIKEISLSFNDIHYMEPNVFVNISGTLQILELSFGLYREDFPMEQLSCLSNLIWLGLDNNNLKVVTNESLATLNELSYINLAFNRISVLPVNLFNGDVHRNLVEVDLSYNVIKKIPEYGFSDLQKLQMINLQSNRIELIESTAFYNLPYLTSIDLAWNQLSNIMENAFVHLPGLINIDLMFNQLQIITLKIFRYTSNGTMPMKLNISHNSLYQIDGDLNSYVYIHHLDVSWNHLTDSQSFRNLGNALKVLDFAHNNLTQLNNHAFGDLELLEILNLSNNNLSSIRRRSFQGLTNLQELNLSYNRIEVLQMEQFTNLRKLRIIDLSYNRIRSLPRDLFQNTRVEYLDVSGNMLSIWPVETLSDIGFTLRNIQFASNQIEYLDSSMFVHTQYLLDLNLSKNRITILPDNTFSFANNLTNLDLSYNPLVVTNLNPILEYMPRLRKLNLCSIGLDVMPDLPFNYLTELDMSKNNLIEISQLNANKYLRVLRLANNKFTNFSLISERLPATVKVLDISGNPIRRVGLYDFIQLRQLEELNIEDIKITNWQIFVRLRNLKALWITTQYHLGDIVSRIPGLQRLYVHVNEDRIDDELFVKLINNTKLNLVDIKGNKLMHITSDAFKSLARNQYLQLRITGTLISELPPGIFYTLKSIPWLAIDLSNNKLIGVATDSFYPNASSWDAVGSRSIIGGLDVQQNPLECDCSLVWVGHWLRRWLRETAQATTVSRDEMQRMITRARSNTCIDPVSKNELSFLELFPEDLLCHASALSSSGQSKQLLPQFLPLLALILYFLPKFICIEIRLLIV